MKYVMGVDGGGTKTGAALLTTDGEIVSYVEKGPSNHHNVGVEKAREIVEEACLEAVRNAGISDRDVEIVVASMAGLDCSLDFKALEEAMVGFPLGRIILVHDSMAALYATNAGGESAIIIAGTGSSTAGINSRGEYARAGGWGYLLADEGSGFYIAKRGVVAALMEYEGRGPSTLITKLLMEKFKAKTPDEIIWHVYAKGMSIVEFARLAPLVTEAARNGDEVAIGILCDAAKELANTVGGVIRKLRMEDDEFPIGLIGGVFRAGELVTNPLKDEIKKLAPRSYLTFPRFPPVAGACLIALEKAGVRLTEDVLKYIENTLKKQGLK
ncbi:MAG: BadF/BadG/BcrA/BcrD ATPase family protein [Thermoproteota archaeon]